MTLRGSDMPPEIIKKQSQGAEVCLNHVRSTSLQTLEGFNKKATTLSQYSLSLISYSNFLFTVHLFTGQIFKCLLSISPLIHCDRSQTTHRPGTVQEDPFESSLEAPQGQGKGLVNLCLLFSAYLAL